VLPILLYLAALIFSLIHAINLSTGLYEILRRTTYILLFFLVISHLKEEKDILNICSVAVATGSIVSLLGIFQYFGTNPDRWLLQVAPPSATFGNKNMAAEYVIMMVPLSVALFLQSNNEKVKLLWAVATIEMVAYVVYANSRGAWLGLTLGGLMCLAFFIKAWLRAKRRVGLNSLTPALSQREREQQSTIREKWGLSLKRTSLLLFLLFIHLFLPKIIPTPAKLEVSYNERVASALDFDSSSVNARIAMWANTLDIIKDYPAGVGINNWEVIYPKYARSRMVDHSFSSETHPIDAHNDYIQMISEISIIGFAFYLWIVFLFLSRCWKSSEIKYSPFFLWSIVGFLTTSFFSFPSKMPATFLFFWLIAGIIVVIKERRENLCSMRQEDKSPQIRNRRWESFRFRHVFLGLSIIYFLSMFFLSYSQIFSDYYLRRADILHARGEIRDSIKACSLSIQNNRFNYWAYFVRGMGHYKMNNFEASARDNLLALKLYPNEPNAHGNLGMAYTEQGLFDLAEREYKEALKLYPEDRRARYRLKELEQKKALYLEAKAGYESSRASSPDSAKTYNMRGYLSYLTGSLDEAIAWYQKAIEKEQKYAEAHNNLANVYRKRGFIDQAIKEHEKAIEIDPAFFAAYRDLGKTYEEKGLFKEALNAYLAALRLKPNDADIHLEMGSFYLTRLRDINLALFHLKRCIELNPKHIMAEGIKSTIDILEEEGK
jgi:tetratricopeptide (TPR) repeat protein/O-antigen ligase